MFFLGGGAQLESQHVKFLLASRNCSKSYRWFVFSPFSNLILYTLHTNLTVLPTIFLFTSRWFFFFLTEQAQLANSASVSNVFSSDVRFHSKMLAHFHAPNFLFQDDSPIVDLKTKTKKTRSIKSRRDEFGVLDLTHYFHSPVIFICRILSQIPSESSNTALLAWTICAHPTHTDVPL